MGGGKFFWNFFWSIFSPNQAILSTFHFFLKKPNFFLGGGQKNLKLFLINFLPKSGNSKHFFFLFIFFKKKSKSWSLCLPCTFENSGHYVGATSFVQHLECTTLECTTLVCTTYECTTPWIYNTLNIQHLECTTLECTTLECTTLECTTFEYTTYSLGDNWMPPFSNFWLLWFLRWGVIYLRTWLQLMWTACFSILSTPGRKDILGFTIEEKTRFT